MLEHILKRLSGLNKEKFVLVPLVGEEGLEEFRIHYDEDNCTPVSTEQAVSLAQRFVEERDIPYSVSYSEAMLVNRRVQEIPTCQERNFFYQSVGFHQWLEMRGEFGKNFDSVPVILNYTTPGEYEVTLTFSKDDVSQREKLYIDSQTGKIRSCARFGVQQRELNADYISECLAHKKQNFILLYVKNGAVAERLQRDLNGEEDVESISYGPRSLIDRDFAEAAFSRMRSGHTTFPNKGNPE
ncbi:hypothetical protein HQ489_01965 [Candidatus Woesearchaeota archaeon]|nr:hypothetical protein [Candidatus Woesearchaeota archaeon]